MSDLVSLKTMKVQLPSLGIPYDKDILIGGDSVRVRNFLMEDQRECSSAAMSLNIYNYFKLILDRFLVEPTSKQINTDDMLMSDILVILYAIKGASWDEKFTIANFRCKGCDGRESPILSMGNFNVQYADDVVENLADFKPKGITYKLGKHDLTCHLPTLLDENKVYSAMKDLKKTKGIKNALLDESLLKLAQCIDTINGKPQPLMLKFESLLKLPPEESEKLSDYISDLDVGILLDDFEVICPKCKVDNCDEVDLGFNPYFFRAPEIDRGPGDTADKTKRSRKLQLQRHSFADPSSVRGDVSQSDENAETGA